MMLLLYLYVVVNYSGIALYGLLIYKCTNIHVIGFWDYKLWQIVYGGVYLIKNYFQLTFLILRRQGVSGGGMWVIRRFSAPKVHLFRKAQWFEGSLVRRFVVVFTIFFFHGFL